MENLPQSPPDGKPNPQVRYLEEYAHSLFQLLPKALNREELRIATEVFLKYHPLEVEDLDAEEWLPTWAGQAMQAITVPGLQDAEVARRAFTLAEAMLTESHRRRLGWVA